LVTAISETSIGARRITTQDDLEFDRRTGIDRGETRGRIDCVAALPAHVHNVLVSLDRRGRVLAEKYRNGVDPGLDSYRLTAAEKQALLFIDEHVSSNSI
jgi:hypothetical protein